MKTPHLLATLALAGLLATASSWGASFSPAGDLSTARDSHTATLLADGRVLAAGGVNGGALASAELYDPATDGWSTTGAFFNNVPRFLHTATLLGNGTVLVAGGHNGSAALASAVLYDPATGTWTATANNLPNQGARYFHTATLLSDGKVLVAGGSNSNNSLASAALYNPGSKLWTATASLATARMGHTATLLANGKVLVAGGYNSVTGDAATAELYDPATGAWTSTGTLATTRSKHTATLLANGKVLIAGGYSNGTYVANAELYDPAPGTWTWSSAGILITPRTHHTATLLADGKVLIAGGYNDFTDSSLASAELYDPATGAWKATASLIIPRDTHTATLLADGKVLIAGGYNDFTNSKLASAELYDPAAISEVMVNDTSSLSVTAINAAGHLAGNLTTSLNKADAFIWKGGATVERLATATLVEPGVSFLSDDGRVTGRSEQGTAIQHIFSRSPDGAVTTLFSMVLPASATGSMPSSATHGDLVAGLFTESAVTGFVWTPQAGYKPLFSTDFPVAYPISINAAGVIAGLYVEKNAPPDAYQPCVWTFMGAQPVRYPLPFPASATGGIALGGNAAGVIYGVVSNSVTGASHACTWTGADLEIVVDLTPPVPNGFSCVSGAASSGTSLVGRYALTNTGDQRPCVWTDGTAASFQSVSSEPLYEQRLRISPDARVAATVGTAANHHAITWKTGTLIDLRPVGAARSTSVGLSDAGEIAGYYELAGGGQRAFAWSEAAGARDLTPANALEAQANVIHANGTIGGWYRDGNLKLHLFTAEATDGVPLKLVGKVVGKAIPSIPPTVKIAGRKKITTTKARLRIKGTATGAVTQVTLKNGKKAVQVAGTASWRAKVKLRPGKNKIAAAATGPGGASAPQRIVITRQ